MKIKELDNMINQVLEEEAKKLIMEQITETDHVIDAVKNFQSLSSLMDKISNVEDIGDGNIGITIKTTPEELVQCCGGDSLSGAQKNLMQGIHHDLEDNGFGNDFDVEIDTSGDENELILGIRISGNNDKTLSDVEEQTKDTNPTADDEKDIILGGEEVDEEKKDKKWIQKAVNPEHEGYCTPMTKSTCTPERKKLAKTFKKMAKNESTQKRSITLSETEMEGLLKKIITETVKTMDPKTEEVLNKDGKQNSDALKAVEKKIKDYLSFKGNDNPEFPNQIGQGEEKAARQNTKPEDEVVDVNRGQGIGDADYEYEPPKAFKDRQEDAIKGSSKMGNPSEAANAIKTDVNKNVVKGIKARKEAKAKEPFYKKEPVPVEQEGKNTPMRNVNEDVQKEIDKMKRMSAYNEKTQ